LTEKVIYSLEGAGPKFRPHSVVCCWAVLLLFHELIFSILRINSALLVLLSACIG